MDLQLAFKELAEVVKRIVHDRIRRYGVNPRTGTNTLVGSNLESSITATTLENGIEFQIADYWEFVSRGWKRTGNYPHTVSKFVKNVNDWVRRKNIRWGNLTQNQIAFLVIKKIWEQGIRPRKFMIYDDEGDLTNMIPELEDYMDKWFDDLFEEIMKDINNYFNG